jgi:predicted phosphatase
MLLPEIEEKVKHLLSKEFIYPDDILEFLRSDNEVWKNFMNFSEPYKRIRIAYIDDARKRPVEFEKRLNNFFRKTRKNKKIVGHGGVDKYY